MTVSDDSVIWRYMDLARYVSLLDSGLFFARASSFADRWEGSWGGRDVMRFREARVNQSRDSIEQMWNREFAQWREALASIGVTCWHESTHESAALWELYLPAGLGVAVRTTVGRLRLSVAGDGRPLDVVKLTYRDYGDLEVGLDAAMSLHFKRSEFKHEAEVRALVRFRTDEMDAMDSLRSLLEHRQTRTVSAGCPRPTITSAKGWESKDRSIEHRVAPEGLHLATDLKILIEQVILSPHVSYVTRRAVIAVTQAFTLDRKLVTESTVGQIPFDRLRFVDDS